MFAYSDEEGTEAVGLPGKIDPALVAERATKLSLLADETCERRAEERVGSTVELLVGSAGTGWAADQAPEVDGSVTLTGAARTVTW